MEEKISLLGKDIISMNNFSRGDIDYILNYANKIKSKDIDVSKSMQGKLMAPLFFEKSTRTSCSFQSAMLHMGGNVLDFDVSTSSVGKGESLRDTIKTIGGYHPDILVVRHPNGGAAKFVADILDIPIINAGDGRNQHPTQTILDLFTINEIQGKVDEVRIAMVGDLRYGRTVHSLALALTKYNNCRVYFVSPQTLSIPLNFIKELNKKNLDFSQHNLDELQDILNKVDIVYMTRIQRERFPVGIEGEQQYEKIKEIYCLKKRMLDNIGKNIKIMHPLPKVFEIDFDIDNSEYDYYFQQAENGLYVRQALLDLILNKKFDYEKRE